MADITGENQPKSLGYKKINTAAGKDTQWKKGQSGNPAGPKPGYRHINSWVQELLHDEEFEATIQQGYKVVEYKGAPVKAIVQAQLIKALSGDTIAYKALVDSGWAKKTETDVTSGSEKIVPILGSVTSEPVED